MYGLPDTLTTLPGDHKYIGCMEKVDSEWHFKKYICIFVTQLFGGASGGCLLCRAVLLTDAREVEHCKDIGLVEFCTEKEL